MKNIFYTILIAFSVFFVSCKSVFVTNKSLPVVNANNTTLTTHVDNAITTPVPIQLTNTVVPVAITNQTTQKPFSFWCKNGDNLEVKKVDDDFDLVIEYCYVNVNISTNEISDLVKEKKKDKNYTTNKSDDQIKADILKESITLVVSSSGNSFVEKIYVPLDNNVVGDGSYGEKKVYIVVPKGTSLSLENNDLNRYSHVYLCGYSVR